MASRTVLGLSRAARAAPRVTPCVASSSRFVSTDVASSAASSGSEDTKLRIENGIVYPPTLAMKAEKTFNFPPLKKVPQTHGVHVATLHMRAYYAYHVDLFSQFAVRAAANLNMPTSGVASLPKTKELVTVLKSPFVHKKSMENFTRITHKRTIKIYDTDPDVLDLFLRYLKRNAVGGVGIKCYINEYEEFGFGSKDIAPIEHLKQANTQAEARVRVRELVKELGGEEFAAPEPVAPAKEQQQQETAAAPKAEAEAEVKATESAEVPKEEAQSEAPKQEEVKPETDSTPKP